MSQWRTWVVLGWFGCVAATGDLIITLTPGSTASEPTASLTGGGSLDSIVGTAADYWEAAFAGSSTSLSMEIVYGWYIGAPLTTAGVLAVSEYEGLGTKKTYIYFDADGSSLFYMDPTPTTNTEWSTFTASSADLGGGTVNTGRVYTGASSAPAGKADMLSVAMHEMGHALGISTGFSVYASEDSDGDIDIDSPRPLPGTAIGVSGSHLSTSTANMSASIVLGERKMLTGIDILALAEVQGFDAVTLDPAVVPEPGSLVLTALAGLATGYRSWRARRAPTR